MRKATLKEKQFVDGVLREAGDDVTDASGIELAVLEAHDKLNFTEVEEEQLPEHPAPSHEEEKS